MAEEHLAGNHGTYTASAIELDESVTNAEGRYSIAGWKKGKEDIFEGRFYIQDEPGVDSLCTWLLANEYE